MARRHAGEEERGSALPPRILIVEDESSLIYALRAKFSRAGFDPTIALNGDIAQELAEQMEFDIILLDLLLPKLNGFEVLARLKEAGKTKNVPVVVFSNLDSREDKERARRLGAARYLLKTQSSIDEVVSEVHDVLKR